MSRVSIRYSKALFESALEEKLIEEVRSDLEMIKIVCIGNPEIQDALINPLIEEYLKANLLREIFGGKVNQLTFKFLQLLSKKKRSGFLLEMIDNYLARILEYKNVLSGSLIAASTLDQNQIESIKQKIEEMTGKAVQLTEHSDESMIGGFIVKIKDTVIDLSIKTQLDKLRTQLIHG